MEPGKAVCNIPSEGAYRVDINGWHYLKLKGSPGQIGRDHGYLLADQILLVVSRMSKLIYIQTGTEWTFFKEHVMKEWAGKFPIMKEWEDEMKGIVEGVNCAIADKQLSYEPLEYADILVWNAYEELVDYWFPNVAHEVYQNMGNSNAKTFKEFHHGAQDHCSAFIATGSYTRDGAIVIAHNSFSPFEEGGFVNVVLDIEPEHGNNIIMQAQPGYIHSFTDYYGNSAGLVITETTIGGFNAYDETQIPEFFRARRAAQYASSLKEFIDYIWEGNNGGYANTWLVGDTKTNEIMRLELGLKFYKDDYTMDGYFAGFNAPLDPRIRNFECENSGFADIRRHQGARQVRIPQLMEQYKGQIDDEIAQKILADHYDVYLQKDNPCSRTICSHYELDDRAFMSQTGRPGPFTPRGAVDGVCATAADAKAMRFWGRFGSSCGCAFDAKKYFAQHPQFDYLSEFIDDRPSQPWTCFPPER